MISRVTVLLPFVPVIETTGIRRSASRIHAGGVVRASAIRAAQRASSRSCAAGQPRPPDGRDVALGEGERRLGDRAGPLRAGPREGDDPVARVRRAVDGDAAAALAVLDPEAPDPVDERARPGRASSRAGTAAPSRTRAWRPGLALAVPGPPPADRDLDLDHRLEPVDVRSLEQADLDQAHGPARIASGERGP